MFVRDNPEFESFPSIPRLNRTIFMTEKIDGSNVSIFFHEDGSYHVQSRNKVITVNDDFAGFARWVSENVDTLFSQLGYGRHSGEWWGSSLGRKYDLKEKRFSLFNTGIWKTEFNEQILTGVDPDNATGSTVCIQAPLCHVVPLLAVVNSIFDEKIVDAIFKMKSHGSYAKPGFMKPEGVVLYHKDANQFFKWLCESDHLPKTVASSMGLPH